MPRILAAAALAACAAARVLAQAPDDISYRLRLTKDPPQYAVNEPIVFEVSLSSRTENKYHANWMALGPWSGRAIDLEPRAEAVDLQAMAQGYVGSFLEGSGLLGAKAVEQTADLTEWYRFEKPGHFRFSVSVNWVWRVKSKEEGGGREQIPLRSNTVEFEIVGTGAGEAQELESVLSAIDGAKNEEDRQGALHRLDLLQTRAAAAEKARRYLGDARSGFNPYYEMLLHSSELDEVIAALEGALTDPRSDPPGGLIALLANLQIRKQMGDPPAWSTDAAQQERWRSLDAKRAELRKELIAKDSGMLLKSMQGRAGAEKADAVLEAWSNVEQGYAAGEAIPEALVELRGEALSAARELSPNQQLQLLTTAWGKMPHEQLLPLVERVAKQKDGAYWAYKFWCEEWPADCTKALLADVQAPGSKLGVETILLIPEAEHPEMDGVLRARLDGAGAQRAGAERNAAAALILRAGSKNIEADVEKFLDRLEEEKFDQGEGYLLGYLFRIGAAGTAKRLQSALLEGQRSYSTGEILRELGQAKNTEPAIPAVKAALNGTDLKTAGAAALFLGQYGPQSARAGLEDRLEKLRGEWRDRRAETASATEYGEAQQETAEFERALVSALAHATAWKLTPEEGEALAAGCMTENCREMAEGKSWMGL